MTKIVSYRSVIHFRLNIGDEFNFLVEKCKKSEVAVIDSRFISHIYFGFT